MQMIHHTTSAWPKQIHKFTNRQLHKIERADSWNHREFVWLILKFQYLHTGDEIIEDWWGEGSDMVMAVMLGCRHFWLTLSQDYPHAMVNIHSILYTTCTHLFKPIHFLFSLFILIHGINFTFPFITGDLYPRLIPQYYIPQGNFCPPCPEGKLGKVVGRLQESINPQFKTWFGENQNVRWSLTTGQTLHNFGGNCW